MRSPEAVGKAKPSEEDYVPTKPKMGGIRKGQYNTAWTGGVPNVDWDQGLVQPNPRHLGQYQQRYEEGKAATAGYER